MGPGMTKRIWDKRRIFVWFFAGIELFFVLIAGTVLWF